MSLRDELSSTHRRWLAAAGALARVFDSVALAEALGLSPAEGADVATAMVAGGLVKRSGRRVRLTPRGRLLAAGVVAEAAGRPIPREESDV